MLRRQLAGVKSRWITPAWMQCSGKLMGARAKSGVAVPNLPNDPFLLG